MSRQVVGTTDGADEMMRRNVRRYYGGAGRGLLAGTIGLLALTAFRLSGGTATPYETVFDFVISITPGEVESALLRLLRDAAKPLLLAGSAGLILLGYAALGVAYEALPAQPRLREPGVRLVIIGAGPLLPIVLLVLGRGWEVGSPVLWAFGLSQLAFVAVFAPLTWAPSSVHDLPPRGRMLRRREFLRIGSRFGLLLVAGVSSAVVAQRLVVRSRLLTLDPAAVLPPRASEGIFLRPELEALVASEVTPIPYFYRVSKNAVDPELSAERWRLTVGGMVGRPLTLDRDDLERLPQVERYQTLMCISNEIGDGLIGNAQWAGVRLMDVLTMAQLSSSARFVVFRSADGYVESISLPQARATILATEMNGAPLEHRHGFPLRALVPGTYGMKNPKWITHIEAAAEEEQGFWTRLGWKAGAALKTFSRIDVPRAQAIVPHETVVGGIAFAGDRGISNVELSDDAGVTWRETELRPPISGTAWTLWATTWTFSEEGEVFLAVRATDGAGALQTVTVHPPFPAGASGYHRIRLSVEGSRR